jgi:hypothetical protein
VKNRPKPQTKVKGSGDAERDISSGLGQAKLSLLPFHIISTI